MAERRFPPPWLPSGDVHMLVGPGGRERTEAELKKLFAAAGFRWVTAVPLPGDFGPSLVEWMPI